jgi:hypothetical protein
MITGGCLCGALRYRAEDEPNLQGLCHCRTCQRLTGSSHVGWMCFAASAVTVEGATRACTTTGGSGRPATRFSCPTCHSIVYGTAEVMPGLINIYAGSLDDTSQFKPQMAIFTRSRPAWDDSSRNLACFETLPSR